MGKKGVAVKKKKRFNNIKKSIKDFIKDEEGFVSKENILKIGLGTISAIGILGSLSNSFAGHTSHGSHNNSTFVDQQPISGTNCYKLVGSHANHSSHSSHGAY